MGSERGGIEICKLSGAVATSNLLKVPGLKKVFKRALFSVFLLHQRTKVVFVSTLKPFFKKAYSFEKYPPSVANFSYSEFNFPLSITFFSFFSGIDFRQCNE